MEKVIKFIEKNLHNLVLWAVIVIVYIINKFFLKIKIIIQDIPILDILFIIALIALLYNILNYFISKSKQSFNNKNLEKLDYKKFIEFINIFDKKAIQFLINHCLENNKYKIFENEEYLIITDKQIDFVMKNLVAVRNKNMTQNFFNNHYFIKFLNGSTIYDNGKEKRIYFARNFYYFLKKYNRFQKD